MRIYCIVLLVPQLCMTLCDPMDCSPPGFSVHGDSPGKNTGVDCSFLLQGILLTQGSNPGLLNCRQILHHLSYREAHVRVQCMFHQILARTSALPPPTPTPTFWPLHFVSVHTPAALLTPGNCFLGFRAPLHFSRHLTLTTPHLSPSGSCLSRGNSKGFPTSVGRGVGEQQLQPKSSWSLSSALFTTHVASLSTGQKD